jgi:hypothetical protein
MPPVEPWAPVCSPQFLKLFDSDLSFQWWDLLQEELEGICEGVRGFGVCMVVFGGVSCGYAQVSWMEVLLLRALAGGVSSF